jgi:predicted enzyme related to lactoylglutathione lyase
VTIVLSKPVVDFGIVTTNPDRMTEFYGTTMGLPQLDPIQMDGFSISRFQLGDTVLKVLVYDAEPTATAAIGGIGDGTGIRYLTISVANLSELLEACRTSDTGSVVDEPVEVRPGAWIAFVTDPDGNIIELVQRGGTL